MSTNSTFRILITDGLEDGGRAILSEQAQVLDGNLSDEPGSYDAVIVRSRTKIGELEIAESLPRLRVIGRAGAGVDNIDLAVADQHGLLVVNAPEAATISVVEHCLALMLSLVRQIPTGDAGLRRGDWLKRELMGSELFGKTLGVIGLGRSGAALAVRAQAFGMTVLACDPYIVKERFMEYQVQEAEKDEILRKSDFISLHVPLTNETHHLMNEDAFVMMKNSARVISVSRGGVIDEEALLDALDRDQIAGAALDVFETEPPDTTRLVIHPKVVLSPHIGGQTQEAQARVSKDIAEEVLNALTGLELRWRVQPNG